MACVYAYFIFHSIAFSRENSRAFSFQRERDQLIFPLEYPHGGCIYVSLFNILKNSSSAGEGYRADMELDAAEDGTMMTKTVIITLGAAAAYMVLVVGLMLYCRYRRRRRKQRYLQEQTDGQEKGEATEVQEEQCDLRETTTTDVAKANSSGSKRKENRESHKSDGTDTAHSQNSNHSKKSKSSYDKLAVSRAQLQELKPLGRGEFGEIFSTKYRPHATTEETTTTVKETVVMVKTLTNTKDENVLQEFKRHLDLLHKLNHEHVARLIGLCRVEEPDYMIIEYTDWGDLKTFLLASKSKETTVSTDGGKPRAPQLTVAQILSLANQVCIALLQFFPEIETRYR